MFYTKAGRLCLAGMLVVLIGMSFNPYARAMSDREAVDAALEALTFEIIAGQNYNMNAILYDLELVRDDTAFTNQGVRIYWHSSRDDVINVRGEVKRPPRGEADAEVELSATLWRGPILDLVKFKLVVKALATPQEEDVALVRERLTFDLIKGDNKELDHITSDLNLIKDDADMTARGVTITWLSSNPQVVDERGRIQRPLFGEREVSITLTAVLLKETAVDFKEFNVVVQPQQTPPLVPTNIDIEGEERIIVSPYLSLQFRYRAVIKDQYGEPLEDYVEWQLQEKPLGLSLQTINGFAIITVDPELEAGRFYLEAISLSRRDLKAGITVEILRPPAVTGISGKAGENMIKVHFSEPVWWHASLESDYFQVEVASLSRSLVQLAPRPRDEAGETLMLELEGPPLQGAQSIELAINEQGAAEIRNLSFLAMTYASPPWQYTVKRVENSLLYFGFSQIVGVINEETGMVRVVIPSHKDIMDLAAVFTHSPGASVTVEGRRQVSGETRNNFSQSVVYTVTAEDGSTREYTVIVQAIISLAVVESRDNIIIPGEGSKEVTYKALLWDHQERIISEERLVWSLKEPRPGVSINENGLLQVDSLAVGGDIVIKVFPQSEPTFYREKCVFLRKISSLTLTGPEEIILQPGTVREEVYTAYVLDHEGNAIEEESVSWRLTEESGDFYLDTRDKRARLLIDYGPPTELELAAFARAFPSVNDMIFIKVKKPPHLVKVEPQKGTQSILAIFDEPVWWGDSLQAEILVRINGVRHEIVPLTSRDQNEAKEVIVLEYGGVPLAVGDRVEVIIYGGAVALIKGTQGVALTYPQRGNAIIQRSEADILRFFLPDQQTPTEFDMEKGEIRVKLAWDAETNMKPELVISPGATIEPGSNVIRDFSSPVSYTVRAEDGTEKEWKILVDKAEPPPALIATTLDPPVLELGESKTFSVGIKTRSIFDGSRITVKLLTEEKTPLPVSRIWRGEVENNHALVEGTVDEWLEAGNYYLVIEVEGLADIELIPWEIQADPTETSANEEEDAGDDETGGTVGDGPQRTP